METLLFVTTSTTHTTALGMRVTAENNDLIRRRACHRNAMPIKNNNHVDPLSDTAVAH